jgi:Ca-activated chloride channel homolog
MTPDSRKTAAILIAAGALVAAAILLHRTPASGGSADSRTATPTDVSSTEPPAKSCKAPGGAASRASTRFERGRASASLSTGKILRGAGGQVFAAFELTTDAAKSTRRQPLNLALVIDRSGSMAGDKLAHAKAAAAALIARLDAGDRIALVQYDDSAQTIVPSVAADSDGKERLLSAVRELGPGGGTNLHGGMVLGRDEVLRSTGTGQVSRVILLSDGLANAGEIDPATIADSARQAADRGVRITTIGVGLDYNEDLMEAIAESGRGNYHYVQDSGALDPVLARELSAAQATVAASVELRLRPACAGVEITEVIGYQTRREGDAVLVPMADLFGGDNRRMVVALRVPDGADGRHGVVNAELRYRDTASRQTHKVELALAVDVTGDAAAAERSVDREVMAEVLKAQSAESVRKAARAYEQGDVAGATEILEQQQNLVDKEGGRYGIEKSKLAPAMEELGGFQAEVQSVDRGSDQGKAALKRRKSTAREMSKGK